MSWIYRPWPIINHKLINTRDITSNNNNKLLAHYSHSELQPKCGLIPIINHDFPKSLIFICVINFRITNLNLPTWGCFKDQKASQRLFLFIRMKHDGTWKQKGSHTETFHRLLMYVTGWDMRMSREVEITVTYGFGDHGENDSTVLFYRAMADYSLISRLMNVTYSSLDTVRPQSILHVVFYYSLTFDVWSLHIPCCTIRQHGGQFWQEQKREGGGGHKADTGLVGEAACLKKTCFFSKWRLTPVSFSFPSATTPPRLLCSLSRKWACIKTWVQLVTRRLVRLHFWLSMSGHSKCQGREIILSSLSLLSTHIHECTHSQKHTRMQVNAAHKNTRPPWRSCMWIRTRTRGNSTHTFLLEHAITSHVLHTYQSVPGDVYATVDKQTRTDRLGYIAMLHTDPAPVPGPWLISPVKMSTRRIPLSNAWQFNFNLACSNMKL